jgi:hypothetical protein
MAMILGMKRKIVRLLYLEIKIDKIKTANIYPNY